MNQRERRLLAEAIRTLADIGLSITDVGVVLGMTRGQVASYASRAGVTFQASHRPGTGGTPESAQRGWETRRARGWTWDRAVDPVRHAS